MRVRLPTPKFLHPLPSIPRRIKFHLHTRTLSTALPPCLIKTTTLPAPHTGNIRILSLNSPRNRNAISHQLLSDLSTQIHTIKTEAEEEAKNGGAIGQGTRVLVLASEIDSCFCAGADLKERIRMSKEETKSFLHSLRATFSTLSLLPIPTISAIASHALGGGFELALSTTFRVIGSTAAVALPETRLAIIPGAGGTYRLKRLVGEARALDLILTGRRIGGEEAFRMGVCERVVEVSGAGGREREMVLEEAVGMAREVCEGGPGAVRGALRAVRVGGEEGEYERVLGMEDRGEALRAFGEKRGAVFRGL